MFNFMKKGSSVTEDKDKERRKKEKKLRKEQQKQARASGTMSAEELLRLDEVRRSLKLRGRRKDKEKLPSGITADYSASFFAQLERDSPVDGNRATSPGNSSQIPGPHNAGGLTQSDSSEASLNSITNQTGQSLPPVPPRPPKRGILKGPRLSLTSLNSDTTDHSHLLIRNTLQNELISYQNLPMAAKIQSFENLSKNELNPSIVLTQNENKPMNNLMLLTSTSPSAESLTSTNSSFATPPFSLSPVGESQGYHRWSRTTNFEDIILPLPEIKPLILPKVRTLKIYRQKGPKNDFGISLRRATILERNDINPSLFINGDSVHNDLNLVGNKSRHFRGVIFAEPGVVGGSATGLLPGDRLLEVNKIKVESKTREEIIEMIKTSQDHVIVKVQPISELSELSTRCLIEKNDDKNTNNADIKKESPTHVSGGTLRRSATRKNNTAAKTDEQLDTQRTWQSSDGELLWIVHRGGFTAAKRTFGEAAQAGKVKIKLLYNDQEVSVDEDDLEKANQPSLDTCEDLAALHYLNEASALHTLRQRYCNNLIHTYAGPTLLIINPMAQLSIYSDKVVGLFRGCKNEDMPPHIYSTAQSAYRSMLCNRRDHSIVFLGRSASGKTTSFKHALYYLTLTAGSVNKFLTIEKLNSINTILESFGNAKTCLNPNATRFTQIFSLDFDQSGVIASASIQILLLERNRIGRRPSNEATFHIMYRLVSGVEGILRKDLLLDNLNETNLFFTPCVKLEDKQKASSEFTRVCQAFDGIGVTKQDQKVIWTVLAAIYHLGCAGAVKGGSGSRWQFASASAAQKGATLLGTSVEEISRITFGQQANNTPSTPRQPFTTPSPPGVGDRGDVVGIEALEGLLVGLYTEVFNCVTALINKSISTSSHTVSSLLLLDSPGFQNPASTGHQSGATIIDLTHNYLQERLQLLFHNTELVAPRDRYAQEQIELDGYCDSGMNPEPIVSLLDKPAQHALLRTSQSDLREADRRGLLWLLDEEALYPGSSDESFLERLFTHYGDRESQLLLRKAPGSLQFILQHLQGTNPVLYTASGWLRASRENPVARSAVGILQESSRDDVSTLFVSCRGLGPSAFVGGSVVGIEGSQSLRRASSIRRTFTSGAAGMKRRSVCLQIKFAIDGLVDTLRRTRTKFVHCLLPQHSLQNSEMDVNIPLLRSQIRGGQILEAVRLYKQGFPEGAPLNEFRRRFGLLAGSLIQLSNGDTQPDEVQVVENILAASEIDSSCYRIGPSQVLFRAGVLSHLEGRRDEQVSGRVVQLQAACRGYLARKRVTRKRVEVVAVRCLQRNVRAFLSVRDWPWWRLLVRVTPLLNVHRTEEELKAKTEELEILRTKVDKLETERFNLKHDNDRLESKLSEMTADLAEEHSTAMMASERLDAETAERVRLERDLLETQMKNKSLQQTSERLEMELLYARSDLNGVHSDSEDANSEHGDSGGVYKQRYERVSRELEFTRRRLQQQHEDDLEQLVGLKKQLEKKLADAYEEVEEQRQVVGQWKRKVQKLNGEMNDLRLLLEEQNSRNNILEKKQRKFDSETQMMHDDIRQEKQAKERIGREKDVLIAEKFTLEQNLADTRLELELKDERLINLQQELDEFTFGGKTEEEVAQLKKIKHELDNKCRDQEEELDDLAGQVQILEQAKLRLEMSLENLRKESRREAQQRDDEIEEVRGNAQKKVKALESQLESEHEERTLLLREKHELERRLTSAEEALRSDHQVDVEVVQRLKRDLKRTKALLRDAQTMLERNKADSPGKAVMRQLRNQLEDSECARLTAVKAKQTLEGEVAELQASLDEGNRLRSDAEDRAGQAHRERAELRGQLEENEEELAEVLKKYRSTVQQLSLEQLSVTEQATRVSELESEKSALKETVAELSARLEAMETLGDPNTSLQQIRLESRVKELESKLELEQTTRSRLEVQMSRHKEALERSTSEATASRSKEQLAQDSVRKLQRNLRELRDEFHTLAARETECIQRRKELEKRLEVSEAENSSARADLRLALQRIEDLQTAMQGEISGSENSDSEHDSYSSDESIDTFLANHKVSPNKSAQPTPSSHDASPRISVKKENSVSISSDQDPNTSFA